MKIFRSRLSVLIAVFTVLLVAVPATFAQEQALYPGDLPTYGSVWLSAGFVPDPYEVYVTSGGSVSARAVLGSECAGFINGSPDFELTWSGVSEELYIGFDASVGDTTLVVRDPYGNYWCSDDVFGLDPEVAFFYPSAGNYQVWVGSYSSSEYNDGVLYITEL